MADKKKKKQQTPKKSVSKKPAAKKTPKATAAKKKTVSAPKKTATKKPVEKAQKQTKAATPKSKSKAIKPDWDFENEKPKRGRAKKEEIIINIPRKSAPQAKQPKSVAKQVTEQLPESAKLKTIHLHFRID